MITEEQIKERNEMFYTERGIAALRKRMENFVELFNRAIYQMNGKMFGFGNFEIKTKEELIGRIRELAEVTGQQFMHRIEVEKNQDGITIHKEWIEMVNIRGESP